MRDIYGHAALMVAVKYNKPEAVKLLYAADPDFHHPPSKADRTPLKLCMSDSSMQEMFKLLLEIAPIQSKTPMGSNGWTVLHYAASSGDLSSVADILRFCPDCSEVVDNKDQNFLHIAVKFEHVEVVRFCVLEIKDIASNVLNGQDKDGNTPLNIAALSGNETITLCLLRDPRVNINAGAETNFENKEDIESKVEINPNTKLLIMIDEQGDTALHNAVLNHKLEAVKQLLEADPDIVYNANNSGETPLSIAIREARTHENRLTGDNTSHY
ncbi:hypothetical protein FRX31_019752 [Thalictrum thalictroides]|uniref:Ankyrin repeat-containing protein n=1 Tax=Thalictrum thalictroides TaxID=46969 RepID=A0A7J6W0I2_THATH|nr:hypothetical protein FRX31_019752 [Thalictrum thalictroides]